MLDPLFDLITAVLAWFYSLWPSYGMAIAFLTLTTTIAVTPLTLKFTRSTLQMQQHMPELKKIQAQHRGDRQAINEATAAFYKEHGLNPVGCLLPMLVQAPIFLVMYRVVDGLTRRTTEIGTQIGFTSRRYADTALGARCRLAPASNPTCGSRGIVDAARRGERAPGRRRGRERRRILKWPTSS